MAGKHWLIHEFIDCVIEVHCQFQIHSYLFHKVVKCLQLSEVYGIMDWIPLSSIDNGSFGIMGFNRETTNIIQIFSCKLLSLYYLLECLDVSFDSVHYELMHEVDF